MKTFRSGSPPIALIAALAFAAPSAQAQAVPPELAELVQKDLKESQTRLAAQGWEIVYSSFSGKQQYWWNEESLACVSLKIKGKKIEGFSPSDAKECTSRVEKARKVWEGYSDGPAPAKSPSLDREREKLASQGYKPTYWVTGLVAGKASEYWWNETTGKCSLVVWFTKDNAYEMTVESEARQCANPAPKKK